MSLCRQSAHDPPGRPVRRERLPNTRNSPLAGAYPRHIDSFGSFYRYESSDSWGLNIRSGVRSEGLSDPDAGAPDIVADNATALDAVVAAAAVAAVARDGQAVGVVADTDSVAADVAAAPGVAAAVAAEPDAVAQLGVAAAVAELDAASAVQLAAVAELGAASAVQLAAAAVAVAFAGL